MLLSYEKYKEYKKDQVSRKLHIIMEQNLLLPFQQKKEMSQSGFDLTDDLYICTEKICFDIFEQVGITTDLI